MWFLFFLLSITNAAALYPNSTITQPSTTNSSPQSLITEPCNTSDGLRNCDRLPEQPYYNYNITADEQNWEFDSPWLYMTGSLEPASASSKSVCELVFQSALSSYKASGELSVLGVIPIRTVSVTTTEEATWTTTETALITYAPYTAWQYVTDFKYSATSSCCFSCTLYGGDLKVFYWPSTVSNPSNGSHIATIVNSAGFTMTSPSIYVALQTLSATDYCGTVAAAETPITMGFDPSFLSTATHWRWDTKLYKGTDIVDYLPWNEIETWTWANWNERRVCGNFTTVYTGTYGTSTLFSEYTSSVSNSVAAFTLTWNPCEPYISIPPAFKSLDPLWTKCFVAYFWLTDPPYALSTADPLVAPTIILSTASETVTALKVVVSSSQSAVASQAVSGGASSTIFSSTASSITSATQAPSAEISSTLMTDITTIISLIATSSTLNPAPQTTSVIQDPTTSTFISNPPAVVIVGSNTITAQSNSVFIVSLAPLPTSTASSFSATVNEINQTPKSTTGQGVDPTLATSIPSGPLSVFTFKSLTITSSSSAILISSQTVTPGGSITISGTSISLATNGATLNIDKTTIQFISPTPTTSPFIYLIGTQTLSAGGPALTISGTTYSLQSAGGGRIIINGITTSISVVNGDPTSKGIGGIIATIGGFGETSSTQIGKTVSASMTGIAGQAFNGTIFLGAASGREGTGQILVLAVVGWLIGWAMTHEIRWVFSY